MLRNLFSQERIGDDVVTADQAGQVEGFGRSIESDRTLAGVFGDGCRRDMAVALENDIRPDFIADDPDVVFFEKGHGLFDFPAFPDAACRVLRRAENGQVDMMLLDFFFHISEIHAPNALFFAKGAEDDVPAGVAQVTDKARIRRAVD